ncbi:MAG: hypothetical protein JXA42_08665 [Anaerolineales bacterium]|nr:hypothetical protein [Anaerolineales bacterium]
MRNQEGTDKTSRSSTHLEYIASKHMHFRSPVTEALPPTTIQTITRVARVTPRLIIFAVISFLTLLFIAAIHLEWLPKHGLGVPVYWLHDTIFLRIKAYSFVLFYPKSWIWWSVILIVSGAVLISWLIDTSLIKKPHTFLLRLALHWPICHPYLFLGAKFLNILGVRPRFLYLLAKAEWEQALLDLTLQPPGDASLLICRRLAGLMRLQLLLTQVLSNESLLKLQTWERWSLTCLHLHVWGAVQKKWFKHSMLTLTKAAGLQEQTLESRYTNRSTPVDLR